MDAGNWISLVSILVTGAIAWYSLKRQGDQDASRRQSETARVALEFALRRKFDLVERISAGAGRWEGLLQYHGNLQQPFTDEGLAEINRLTGGWEEWGSFRAAAHELGDGAIASACIGLGNTVHPLLLKREDLDARTYHQWEAQAYEQLKVIWDGLARIRGDLEAELDRIAASAKG